MRVLVIGAGHMAAAFVSQLVRSGHSVSLTARDLARAQALAAVHPGVVALAPAQAAASAEIVIVATRYADSVAAAKSIGDLCGKTVIDISNPLTADYMVTMDRCTSAGEDLAKALPGARVVKAFNTVFAPVLAAGADFGNGHVVPVFFAGDDGAAKKQVAQLISSLGFVAIDAGPLKHARYLEAVAGFGIYLAYGAGKGTSIAPFWIERAESVAGT